MKCPHCGKETDSPSGMDKAERAAELTLLQYHVNVPDSLKKPLKPMEKAKAVAAIEQACADFEREYGIDLRWKSDAKQKGALPPGEGRQG